MNRGAILMVAMGLAVGFGLGKMTSPMPGTSSMNGTRTDLVSTDITGSEDQSERVLELEEQVEELEQRLEDKDTALQAAQSSLADVRAKAEDLEHSARMRWIESGSDRALQQTNDAEDLISGVDDTESSLDDASDP